MYSNAVRVVSQALLGSIWFSKGIWSLKKNPPLFHCSAVSPKVDLEWKGVTAWPC